MRLDGVTLGGIRLDLEQDMGVGRIADLEIAASALPLAFCEARGEREN